MIPISETKVLDHGLLAIESVWGDDLRPARIARTSFRNSDADKTRLENEGLIKYLQRHHHDTPFEFCGVTVYAVMPIMTARQWVRHRAASINEESLRYVDARREFYVPAADRCQLQSQSNKQGSSVECVEDPQFVRDLIERTNNASFDAYDQLLETGLARELARSVLPLGTYTAWYWQANLRMLLHFLSLRTDPHAQYELRVYAEAMLEQVRPIFPTVIKAWEAESARCSVGVTLP